MPPLTPKNRESGTVAPSGSSANLSATARLTVELVQIQRGRHLAARQRLERGLSRDQELLLALHRVISDPPQRYPPVVEVTGRPSPGDRSVSRTSPLGPDTESHQSRLDQLDSERAGDRVVLPYHHVGHDVRGSRRRVAVERWMWPQPPPDQGEDLLDVRPRHPQGLRDRGEAPVACVNSVVSDLQADRNSWSLLAGRASAASPQTRGARSERVPERPPAVPPRVLHLPDHGKACPIGVGDQALALETPKSRVEGEAGSGGIVPVRLAEVVENA
jgi:hypothetical protein